MDVLEKFLHFRKPMSGWFQRVCRFYPDLLVIGDPLAPDAALTAKGIAQAFAHCEMRDAPVRLEVTRVEGTVLVIGLDALHRICRVQILRGGDEIISSAEEKLPPLAPGTAPAFFKITPAGNSLRLLLSRKDGRIRWIRL